MQEVTRVVAQVARLEGLASVVPDFLKRELPIVQRHANGRRGADVTAARHGREVVDAPYDPLLIEPCRTPSENAAERIPPPESARPFNSFTAVGILFMWAGR